jgi:hypothetical protein
MNLVAHEFGQVLQLIRLEEMRPASGVYIPDLVQAIGVRYRFQTGPDLSKPLPTDGLKFEHGLLSVDGRPINIRSFGLYNDGLVIACWNTDDADIITDEFIGWSIEAFHLRAPQTHIQRRYASNVIVDFDVPMDDFLIGFNQIAVAYASAVQAAQGEAVEAHLHRIVIGPDPQPGANATQNTLLLEQRLGTAASEKRYFSGAPLTSAAHVALLAEIEGIVASRTERRHVN